MQVFEDAKRLLETGGRQLPMDPFGRHVRRLPDEAALEQPGQRPPRARASLASTLRIGRSSSTVWCAAPALLLLRI